MTDESANEHVNTSQPKTLRGLKLRGVRAVKTVLTSVGRVNVSDYDKSKHGPKAKADQLPVRKSKKVAKAADKDSAKAED